MPVFFHLPTRHRPDDRQEEIWRAGGSVPVEPEGKTATAQAWIYQTWLRLFEVGADVVLVEELPCEGIAVTLNGWLAPEFVAPRGLFLAGIVADGLPHPGVDLQILQNLWHAQHLPGAVFMPHWPQPGLVPRDPSRGAKLENVCFYGDPRNLASELRSDEWQHRLFKATGAHFKVCRSDCWHDYRDTDAVVAIRGFGRGRQPHKPATKLYNAWLAGVPFVAGNDSAYSAEGNAGSDYLTARSADEVIARVCELRDMPRLRERLVARGRQRAGKLQTRELITGWGGMLALMSRRYGRKLRKTKLRLYVERRLKAVLYHADALRRRD